MTHTITITKVGNSDAMILPKTLMASKHLSRGDKLYITETPDGFKVSAYDADLVRQMEIAEGIMNKYRDVLKKLAE